MWHRAAAACAIIGCCGAACLMWAMRRCSNYTFVYDKAWPRPFPYPDEWLLRWHNHLDRLYPTRGYIKIHGEWPRIHLYLLEGTFFFLSVALVGLIPFVPRAWRWLRERWAKLV